MSTPQPITISLPDGQAVSGLLTNPEKPKAGCILAHGAGAGMSHPWLAAMADGLAQRNVATLRYQFLYMEQHSRRPDPPKVAHAAVRAAVAKAGRQWPGLPLFAGGKSFGGRMTSQAQAAEPLPGVRGLVFLGFPLHPPEKPGTERAQHLADVHVPMLFLQGTKDEFAHLELLEPVVKGLGSMATLELFPDANHSFHVPARTGRKDADVREQLLDIMVEWMGRR